MKITNYDRVSSLDSNDVLLLDGNRGTKTIYVSDVTKESKLTKIGPVTISASGQTITDSRITSDMIVTSYHYSSDRNIGSNIVIVTSNGSATVSLTLKGTGTITLTLYLEKCINP